MLSVCVSIAFKFLDQIARISLNEHYAIKDIPKAVLLNFLHSVIITWRTRDVQGGGDTNCTYVRILKLLLREIIGKTCSLRWYCCRVLNNKMASVRKMSLGLSVIAIKKIAGVRNVMSGVEMEHRQAYTVSVKYCLSRQI